MGPHSPSEFDDWYLTTLRKSDHEICNYTNLKTRHFLGDEGTQFLVDTSGIHKGALPEKRDRLLCQFTYGVLPKPLAKYSPKTMVINNESPIAPRVLTQFPYSYVNRLFVRGG